MLYILIFLLVDYWLSYEEEKIKQPSHKNNN